MEGTSDDVAKLAIAAMISSNILVVVGLGLRGLSFRRFAIVVLAGGMVDAAVGWSIGSLLFSSGNWDLEWIVTICLAPYGIWFVFILGIGKENERTQPDS